MRGGPALLRWFIFLCSLTLVLTGVVRADEVGKVRILRVDNTHYPCVVAAVVVTDAKRGPVKGLEPAQFLTAEDGTPQWVQRFAEARLSNQPLKVVLVLDTSGSMTNEMPTLKSAARAFLEQMSAKDSVGVIRFSTSATLVAPLGPVSEVTRQAIDGLTADGGTNFYPAIDQALDLVGDDIETFRVIVALTDGIADQSARENTIKKCQDQGVPVFCIGLEGQDPTGEKKIESGDLEKLAEPTGGCFYATGAGDLKDLFQKIAQQLNSIYFLKYHSNQLHWGPKVATLKIQVSGVEDAVNFFAPAQWLRILLVTIPTIALSVFMAWSLLLAIRRRNG